MKEKLIFKKKEIVEKFSPEGEECELYDINDLSINDAGMGTVEVILIIVVLIGLVLIFKKQIRSIVESIMNKISSDSDSVMS